jgi:hypothetical protein
MQTEIKWNDSKDIRRVWDTKGPTNIVTKEHDDFARWIVAIWGVNECIFRRGYV